MFHEYYIRRSPGLQSIRLRHRSKNKLFYDCRRMLKGSLSGSAHIPKYLTHPWSNALSTLYDASWANLVLPYPTRWCILSQTSWSPLWIQSAVGRPRGRVAR